MANYFKVDRKITKWKYFKYPAYTCVWIYLLSRANYKDGYSMGCLLHAGQLYETYDSIAEHVNTPKGTVRRILQVLRDEHQVSTQVSNHGMIITIEKWAQYQDDGYKSEHPNEHPNEQPNEHPSEQPNEQPNEHQSITYKAFKAFKQDNKITNTEDKRSCDSEKASPSPAKLSTRFVKPTVDEIADYVNSIGFETLDAEYFWNYYQSNGWKVGRNPMKDWRATVRTWRRNEQNKNKPRKEKLAF